MKLEIRKVENARLTLCPINIPDCGFNPPDS